MSRGNGVPDGIQNENEIMPPPTSALSVDLQSQDIQLNEVLSSSLEAVKAELLEETSQSSMLSSDSSRPSSSATSFSQSSESQTVLSPPIKDMFVQSVNPMQPNDIKNLQMMVTFQNPGQHMDLLKQSDSVVSPELVKIKQELIRRNSSSQDGSLFQQLNLVGSMPVSSIMVDPTASNHSYNSIQMQTDTPQMKPSMLMESYPTVSRIPMIGGGGMPSLSQDIIMQDTSLPMGIPHSMSSSNPRTPENILNTNIAPSMMCTSINNSNTILPPSVLPETNALLPHGMPSTADTANALVPPPQQNTLTIGRNTSPVAVKKMILNAAADILTSPEPTQETRSTIKALMAINTDAILNQVPSVVDPRQRQQPQQHAISQSSIGHVENMYDQSANTSQISVGSGGIKTVSTDSLAPSMRGTSMENNDVNLMTVSRHEMLTPSQLNELNNTIR